MNLNEVRVEVVRPAEETRFQALMQAHHYLGALPKIGHTLWYVALWREQWVALLSFSAPAWKCGPRDAWIGWDFRHQYDRLHLIANHSRFLILPDWHVPNLGSRVLALSERRLRADWPARFGHPLLLLETFVDPQRFHGTLYRAANWLEVGETRGFRRIRGGYSATAQAPKRVFLRPLVRNAQQWLSRPVLDPRHCHGVTRIMLSAEQMNSLPEYFADIFDPRRPQGRRHPLPVVLAIATAATLCGMRGYKAIGEWAEDLGQKARARFRCRWRNGRYHVPSESIIRDVLIRVDPEELDAALQRWNADFGQDDESLAIDGKTMCNAIDDDGRQCHVLSALGHDSHLCHAQKKVGMLPREDDSLKQTNEIGMVIPLLDTIDINAKTITTDALLTQRKLATYLGQRNADYVFIVKENQPTLHADLRLAFAERGTPDFQETPNCAHGRIETRAIWTTTVLNDYLDFPGVNQAFCIERHTVEKRTGKTSTELVYGITSHTPETADPERVLALNRGHWRIENSCHYVIDWNWDEDRSTIRTGFGPQNTTRLRRFATGLIKATPTDSVATTIRRLQRNVRLVFDYLRMTNNSARAARPQTAGG